MGEALAVFAHHINAGFAARPGGALQSPRGDGAEFGVGLVEQEKVAKVENFRRLGCKIKMRVVEKSVGAALMKEGAPPC